jgi:hypothetical protein
MAGKQRAAEQQAEGWAEYRRQREEAERQCRVGVIAEFDTGDHEATMRAMADEILKYRRAVKLLAKAIGWTDAGAPFALISPGPHWPFEAQLAWRSIRRSSKRASIFVCVS